MAQPFTELLAADVVEHDLIAAAEPAADRDDQRALVALFTATSFLASGLLFAVQPMVTRMLLPQLGGSAAAWNTAMVFFQTALLLGYLGAHVSLRSLGVRRHTVMQVAAMVVAALTLPVALPGGWEAPRDGGTELWTLAALTFMVGAPFVALATCSPTLQRWFSATSHRSAGDPYFLYAAGNAGSLLALLAYPLLLDRTLSVGDQAGAWTVGFVALVVLVLGCASTTRRHVAQHPQTSVVPARLDLRTMRLRWIAWAAVPSALLLGTTRHLASDVASIPLLWVVPLSLYLATFIAAFGRRGERWLHVGRDTAVVVGLPALFTGSGHVTFSWGPLVLALVAMTAICLMAHCRLAQDRPPAADLTGFYVSLSIGGAIGGGLAALVAPLVFDQVLEYPLAVAAGLALVPPAARTVAPDASGRPMRLLALLATLALVTFAAIGLTAAVLVTLVSGLAAVTVPRLPVVSGAALATVLLVILYGTSSDVIHSERTFFGVSRVERSADGSRHLMVSGSTIHGMQVVAPERETKPTSYYLPEGPVGQVLGERALAGPLDIGVIGLGAGELASYTRVDDSMTFYEIDPGVARIAARPDLFTYLSDARGAVSVEIGDGRLLVEQAPNRHDVLIVDAFSSDAIPMHLLTQEAIATYEASLRPGGVLLIHVTNRYFDLVPAVAATGRANGLEVMVGRTGTGGQPDEIASTWVVLARSADLSAVTSSSGRWTEPRSGPVWTDAKADLIGALDL